MSSDGILRIPRTRQHRLLKLLDQRPEDGVLEMLITPEGGLVTRYKTGPDGKFLMKPQGGDLVPIVETLEIVFVDEPDPLNASLEYRSHRG